MRRSLLSIAGLTLLTLIIYGDILFAVEPARYPWASDTLGHALKAEYLGQKLAAGDFYPNLQPEWYLGQQMLRYYPPLPYYVLVGIHRVVGDLLAATSWFIAACALLGALSWLLYRRWLGWGMAALGGALFLFLPDNIRVALAEGNLPRVLATALLPLAVYCLLRVLEEQPARRYWLGLVLCFAAIVLSHAMMAAIYAACCGVVALLFLGGRTTTPRRAVGAISGIALGLLLSSWWLLPSLTGGITEINAAAVTEALTVFPLTYYLNPTARIGTPEAIYVGLVLLVMPLVLLFVRAGRAWTPIALTLAGCAGVLISTPGFNNLFNSLPFHQLFWPLRFLGVASFALLLALVWRLRTLFAQSPLIALAIVAVLVVDNGRSLALIHLRPLNPDVAAVATQLQSSPGWRVATLDASRLGSAAAYAFTAQGKREQVFGWAYQGARTAATVAALNETLENGAMAYLRDRLSLYGVDDVVLLRDLPRAPEVAATLADAGFDPIYQGEMVTHYRRDGGPRAYRAAWSALGIGRGAQNLAFWFPQLVVGGSSVVDDYTLDELRRYKTVVFSGFRWRDRANAEELVRSAAAAGVHVIVDLTGAPEEPLARLPRFLDVWGEQVVFNGQAVRITGDGQMYELQPLGDASALWQAYVPQGLDADVLTFDYLGEQSTALGYKQVGAGRVWFVGLNLPYHAIVNNDPAANTLLSRVLQLPPNTPAERQALPLDNYQADQHGYTFTYTLNTADRLFVPVAFHEGTVVEVDGAPVTASSFERLLAFDAPAGTHNVSIRIQPTLISTLGQALSAIALICVLAMFIGYWRQPHSGASQIGADHSRASAQEKPGDEHNAALAAS
jgi:uncharacterized membrane protein